MWEQIISLLGAAMILTAFGGQQAHKLKQDGISYLLLNLFGGAILAIIAFRIRQIGLTAVESAWTLISLYGLLRLVAK